MTRLRPTKPSRFIRRRRRSRRFRPRRHRLNTRPSSLVRKR